MPAQILPNHLEIQVFTVSGQCVARYVTTQPPPGMPISVAVLADGTYAVVERASQRAYAIDKSGNRRRFSEDTGIPGAAGQGGRVPFIERRPSVFV